jgi:ribosomal protein S18 acetylase RimI-like enzyme
MIKVRRARPGDLETIVDFNARLAEESEGVELDRDRLRSGVANALSDERRAFYLIAERAGDPIGQLMVTYEWSDWRNGVFWWLQSVFVRPEFRRQGVLKTLYGRVLELAGQSNVCGIRLYVERENVPAIAAYESFGITRTVFEMLEHDFVIQRGPDHTGSN